MSKKNTSVLWSVDQSNSLEATDRARAQKNIGLSTDFVKSVGANNFVSGVSYDNNKNLQLTSSELNLSAIKATTPDRSVVTDNSGNVVVNDLSTSTPSASGTATSFISAVTQNSIGKLSSISKANLPEASTSVKGIVQLGTTSSTAAAGDHTHSVAVASTSGTGGSAGFMSAADKEKLNNLAAVNDGSLYVKFGNNSSTKEFSANQSSDHTMLFSNVASTGQYSDLINTPRFQSVTYTVNNVTVAEGTYSFPNSAYEFSDVTVPPGKIFNGSMILQHFDFGTQYASEIDIGWILGTNGSSFTMAFNRANGPWTYVVPMCCDNTLGTSTLTVNLILGGTVEVTNTNKRVQFQGMLIDFSHIV